MTYGDLGRWMQWLLTTHARRYHRHYTAIGHVWQDRFKAYPVQHDEHLVTVLRYVERNAVRAESRIGTGRAFRSGFGPIRSCWGANLFVTDIG